MNTLSPRDVKQSHDRAARWRVLVMALGLGYANGVMANHLVSSITDSIAEPITCTAGLGEEPTPEPTVALVSAALTAAEQVTERPKQICRGKVTDYVLDFDGKNVLIMIKAEPQFKGCELKLTITPAKPKHEDKGDGLIVFPYDKEPVKISIEGQFVCKKADGGNLIVPMDSLAVTFQPPDTFIYPLR